MFPAVVGQYRHRHRVEYELHECGVPDDGDDVGFDQVDEPDRRDEDGGDRRAVPDVEHRAYLGQEALPCYGKKLPKRYSVISHVHIFSPSGEIFIPKQVYLWRVY